MDENEISYIIRGCVFKIYNAIGPGLLESVYEKILVYEMQNAGLKVRSQIAVPLIYQGINLDMGYRMDILVEDKVVVEVKCVENIIELHHMQLLTYLRLSEKKLGLLVNFKTTNISTSIFRKVNDL